MIVNQAYRFALDLTPGQECQVLAHAGAARVARNWALARVKAVTDQRTAERSYGVTDADLTPAIFWTWTLPALRKECNAATSEVAPWWPTVSQEAFNTGPDALTRGLKNWSDSRSGKRAGRPVPVSAGPTPGWATCAATACTHSPPGWPASTARSWSRTST